MCKICVIKSARDTAAGSDAVAALRSAAVGETLVCVVT